VGWKEALVVGRAAEGFFSLRLFNRSVSMAKGCEKAVVRDQRSVCELEDISNSSTTKDEIQFNSIPVVILAIGGEVWLNVCASTPPFNMEGHFLPQATIPALTALPLRQSIGPDDGTTILPMRSIRPPSAKSTKKATNFAIPRAGVTATMSKEAQLSIAERDFILEALREDVRLDGRKPDQFRPVDISFGEEYGHVKLQLGKTRCALPIDPLHIAFTDRPFSLIVRISAEVTKPREERPLDGLFNINMELTSMGSPAWENGRYDHSACYVAWLFLINASTAPTISRHLPQTPLTVSFVTPTLLIPNLSAS
jgi:hypothetical protein